MDTVSPWFPGMHEGLPYVGLGCQSGEIARECFAQQRGSDLVPRLSETPRQTVWLAAFVVLYVALDWVSYIRPLQDLNVTPWNPAPALGLLLLVRRGRTGIPALFAAIVASDVIVRNIPGDLATTLLLDAILTTGYAAIARLLRRYLPEGGMFSERRGLLRWSLIVIVGSLAISLVFVSTLWASRLLPAADWFDALGRFWIGDSVGIFVALPLFWWLQDAARRMVFRATILRWETTGYLALALLTLWIAFVPGATVHFRYLYVLFLPVVWAASRQGLVGAVFCVTMLQLGMIVAGLLYQPTEISLLELQMRAFLLALVGFLIGVAVDELRRSTADLRESLRLAAAGEMAGALAHELNQPLTALSAYASACEQLLERGAGDGQLRNVIDRMIGEAARAAEVVRRLRDFFGTGATKLEKITLAKITETVTSTFQTKAVAADVEFVVGQIPAVTINVDRVQMEVVVRNLLANAFEAVAEISAGPRRVTLTANIETADRLVVEVIDSGPGPKAAFSKQLFEPFASTKSSGLGLGLAISRAIAEAHGGTLTAETTGRGCFRLTLPIETRSPHSHG